MDDQGGQPDADALRELLRHRGEARGAAHRIRRHVGVLKCRTAVNCIDREKPPMNRTTTMSMNGVATWKKPQPMR